VLAEGGQNVCLVEGDLRKPRVSKYLGVVGSVGLSSVLAGKADLDAVLQPTQYSGLTVLASGPIPPNPSELLGTETARQVLADLRGRFDYVIVDASPLLPVTDATVLTAMSDGALVIARHAETKRDQLSRAVGNLHSVGATILGTIITMTPSRGRGVYEYKYYYETDKSLPQMQQAAPAQPAVQQQPPQHQAPQQPQPAPYVRDEYPSQQYGPNGGDQQEVPAYQGAPAYQGDQGQQWHGGPDHYGNEQQAGAPVPPTPRRTRRYRDDQEAWSETDAPRDHTQ